MIPASFRSRGVLRVLNVAAVGFALAAVTSALLLDVVQWGGFRSLVAGASTWLVGTVWAAGLRWRRTVGGSSLRRGWVASPALAVLNAAIVGAGDSFLVLVDGVHWVPEWPTSLGDLVSSLLGGAFLGVTLGAVLWLPALVATMICFGAPIAWAQRLARKGLAGEERGECIVGLVCVVMSFAVALITGRDPMGGAVARGDLEWFLAARLMTRALGLSGALTGGVATLLAAARELRRRRFVADAEAGKIAGYRVDSTREGKVLVRVIAHGDGYRVADFEEQVFELDARQAPRTDVRR